MRTVLLFVLILNVFAGYAQRIGGEIELAGFMLGQYRKNVHHELGPPIKVIRPKGWIYEFHKIKPDTSVYALFKYEPADTTKIYSIQISGKRYPEMAPFRGLRLGATEAEVDRVLGVPDKVEKIEDLRLTLKYYPHKNYSVDIDSHGKLFGIQIFGNILRNKPHHETPNIHGFHKAVVARNIDSLLHYLHPDVQFIKGGKVIEFKGAARTELKDLNSEVTRLLLGDQQSVWYAFAKEYAEGTSHLSVHHESKEITSLDKFFDSNVLESVLLKAHAGRWAVYQITFR